ncbi:MAG: GNAT family N-acetyltransferase [Saprospiraceae bacterium]|nr:GNAT family N-acetyltransferase [Saprospiraceae bacterium]
MNLIHRQAIYRDFCRKYGDQLPIFYQDWYLDALSQENVWDVAWVENNDKIICVMPFFVKRKLGFKFAYMPLFYKFGGPFVVPEFRITSKLEQKTLKLLCEKLPELDEWQVCFRPEIDNWLPFYWSGFRQTTFYTYRIHNLHDILSAYERITNDYRRRIRNAQDLFYLSDALTIDTVYELGKEPFDRINRAFPISSRYVTELHKHLEAHNQAKYFIACDKEHRPHAVFYVMWDAHNAYALIKGTSPSHKGSDASIWVVWKALEWIAQNTNVETFDFLGSMLPTIEPFMRQFGAIQTPYFSMSKTNSRLLSILKYIKNQ